MCVFAVEVIQISTAVKYAAVSLIQYAEKRRAVWGRGQQRSIRLRVGQCWIRFPDIALRGRDAGSHNAE